MSELQKLRELNQRIKAVAAAQSAFYQDFGQKLDREIAETKAKRIEFESKMNQPANVPAIAIPIPTKVESDRPEQTDLRDISEQQMFNMTSAQRDALYQQFAQSIKLS